MKLNVILVTYNHSKYIEESLRSILFQKTDFDFDVIIADDQSTDDTLQRIKKLEKQTKIPFRYLTAEKNLGITKNYQRAFRACDAEYIAVMEGDDFWTTPDRLQTHMDFLDHHHECTMSFNRYMRGNQEESNFRLFPPWDCGKSYQLVTSRDIAKDNFIGNFSACVYRRTAIEALPPEMFDLTAYDWITNIMVGKSGMIAYLTEVMSFYRVHSGSAWSTQSEEENLDKTLAYIDDYDKLTNQLFHSEFDVYRGLVNQRKMTINLVPLGKRQKIKTILKRIKDFTPPIIVYIFKLLIPEKIWNKMKG